MEENVALDSSKQKKFVKSIKGIKKLIKKNDGKSASVDVPKVKDGGIRKKKHKSRGLVYLSHIPHGFYEHQMTQYFKQFGVVTNARVIRSKRTGNSKGFAFVEFKEPSVGEIVAETMNNYLMGKRLIKAAYIPPDKQKRHAMRKNWNAVYNPGNNLRIKMKKAYNANKDEAGELQIAKKLLSNLNKNKKKLGDLGINYDFFTPVDVPEVLQSGEVPVKKEEGEVKENVLKSKKNKKKSMLTKDTEVVHIQKVGKVYAVHKSESEHNKPEKDVRVKEKSKKGVKNVQESESTNKQNQKKQNLKDQGVKVKPPEDFLKIAEDSDSSDSTYQFDSDEYEKMLENEDEFNSDITSGENSDEAADKKSPSGEASSVEEGTDDESVEDLPPIKSKAKYGLINVAQSLLMKHAGKQLMQKKNPQKAKRKAPETLAPAGPKKTKFKKQNKPPTSKQFKKKK